MSRYIDESIKSLIYDLETEAKSAHDDDPDNEYLDGYFDGLHHAAKELSTTPTVDAVPVVFVNDPFRVVYQAFKELYPDKECEILFDYNVETTDTHERVKGVTIFPDDGSIPQIRIDCEQTIDQISGILAHELAHVALGKPDWDDRELDHGEDFEKTLDAIFDRFNELQGFCADGERRDDEQPS
jgi:hypothetical protein